MARPVEAVSGDQRGMYMIGDLAALRNKPVPMAELHADGTVPPGTSFNRPQRLASPTFQTPSSYTAVPV